MPGKSWMVASKIQASYGIRKSTKKGCPKLGYFLQISHTELMVSWRDQDQKMMRLTKKKILESGPRNSDFLTAERARK